MSGRTLLVDAGVAALAAILLVIMAPGLAVVGLVALFVLLVIAVTYGVERWRGHRGRRRHSHLSGR